MKPTEQNHDYTIFFCSDKLHTIYAGGQVWFWIPFIYFVLQIYLRHCMTVLYINTRQDIGNFFFATLCIFSDTCSFLSTNQEIQ